MKGLGQVRECEMFTCGVIGCIAIDCICSGNGAGVIKCGTRTISIEEGFIALNTAERMPNDDVDNQEVNQVWLKT